MKVSLTWLKELVKLNFSTVDLENLLSLRTIGIKEKTEKSIELDMKGYNRADLLSMRGVAMEIAAITNSNLNFKEENKFIWEGKNLPEALVKVENQKLAPLYCIAQISGLRVSKSSQNWVSKLEECGMRSVNNVADITNLIMLEYGQPMHAFDASKIKDEKLIVRVARKGEEIETLDGNKRKLETSDLLIADSQKAVGIAGVMGGKNSEVREQTKTILLEAAIFDPVAIRKTAQRLNLASEASRRFQHGLTKKRLFQALNSAIKMYETLGGRLTAISIIGDTYDKVRKIQLRKGEIDSLIGFNISAKDIEKYLSQLNFKLASLASQGVSLRGWEVTVPYYRLDVEIEADLIEEVARMYGYGKIKPQQLKGNALLKIDQSLFNNIYDLKVNLAKQGLTEIQTYSFYSTAVIENCKLKIKNLIKIANPISAETEFLRDSIWPNLLEAVAKNFKQGIKQIAILEIGKIYKPQKDQLPKEEYKLAISLSDNSDNSIQKLWSFFQNLPSHPRGVNLTLKQEETKDESFHPVRFAKILKEGKEIGFIAEIHPRITDKFGISQRVAVLELNF